MLSHSVFHTLYSTSMYVLIKLFAVWSLKIIEIASRLLFSILSRSHVALIKFALLACFRCSSFTTKHRVLAITIENNKITNSRNYKRLKMNSNAIIVSIRYVDFY